MAAVMIVVAILFLAAGCRCFLSDAFRTVYAGHCDRPRGTRTGSSKRCDGEEGDEDDVDQPTRQQQVSANFYMERL
jgi:hypothetical protein